MTEPTTPPPPDEPTADETFTWTQPSAAPGTAGSAATSLLESVRDAVDELAERAAPSVREFSARAAEFAAIAADRAAPLAKRAGEATADASGKLATLSRSWAADLRATMAGAEPSSSSTDVDGPSASPADAANPAGDGPGEPEDASSPS